MVIEQIVLCHRKRHGILLNVLSEKVGIGLLVIIILDKLLMPIDSEYLSLINTGLEILAMIICILVIEKKIS